MRVEGAGGEFLGIGYLNPDSQIAVRILSFEDTAVDAEFFKGRIKAALELRSEIPMAETNAYRLIQSEGDFIPGLIVDRYADYLVAQFLTAGMEKWKETIAEILHELMPVKGIFEKDDPEVRSLEGLDKQIGVLWGEEPPEFIEITENGNRFFVDVKRGQKTGFFLDQRDNRRLVGNLSAGKRVLNCFAYTGGFSVYALRGGAKDVVSVESQELACKQAERHGVEMGAGDRHKVVRADVFEYLRQAEGEFDVIVLDPPGFCKSKAGVNGASRGYKDINLFALKRLAPGGMLLTCSCSSFISADLFQKIVFGAAKDAARSVRILLHTANPMDHPTDLSHPEGSYLKGLLCQVL